MPDGPIVLSHVVLKADAGLGNGARLLATGQTTVYVAGDNGTNQKGIAKSYTVLTTGQYAGNTNITINSKTDAHPNACVIDNNTGLMWSRTQSASVGPSSNGFIPWTTTGAGGTAEGIFPYVAAANAASLSGYTDWRIPNINELLSLCDYEAPTSVPDTTAFPGFSAANFWSSTTRPSGTTAAVGVNFSGVGGFQDFKTSGNLLILVRG
jgi:hypothetical protein